MIGWLRRRREARQEATKPELMSSSEFEAFYGWGEVPERFLPEFADEIGDEYARGELTQQELEDGLDDLTGITRMEGR